MKSQVSFFASLLAALVPIHAFTAPSNTTSGRRLQSSSTVTLFIKLDDFPEESSWSLVDSVSSVEVDSISPGHYTQDLGSLIVVEYLTVTDGVDYQFIMEDGYGDGLLDGWFSLHYGRWNLFEAPPEDLIIFKDDLSEHEFIVLFTARPASPTPSTPSPTLGPTPAPTMCNPNDGFDVAQDPFEKNHLFSTTEAQFKGDAFCTRHRNYVDCTNERAEDCQWIFLTQSDRRGTCRVDPISKCLQKASCVCYTEDFQGGPGDGVLMHLPISVTSRDISPFVNLVSAYWEYYEFPTVQNEAHPQDDGFFISKVDFTARELHYVLDDSHPILSTSRKTVCFKLHYLYMDVPMVGKIWDGFGLRVSIDTSGGTDVVTINGRGYQLPANLELWTCTQVCITDDSLFVAGNGVTRVQNEEASVTSSSSLVLGSFSGELFDVRVYQDTPSYPEIREIGARCAKPNDPEALYMTRDIDLPFLRLGCNFDIEEIYGILPTNGGQTYSSGAFATLWMHPANDPANPGEWLNVPEGSFDEEYFFQHAKLQTYQWERHYFENDMIGFDLVPYREFTVDEVPEFSARTFNNPCRYMHQNNNDWDFPLYGEGIIKKWTDSVFDMGVVYRDNGLPGYSFVTHELFHQFHATLVDAYNAAPSGWLQESAAEFAPSYLFPGSHVILASVSLAPAWPLGYGRNDAEANPNIFSPELSFSDRIRGGHYYGTWLLWWFLAEHAALPHLLGQMFSIDGNIEGYWHGKLSVLRLLLHSHNLDLGDVWGTFVAHFRTWDFMNGQIWSEVEEFDFVDLMSDPGAGLPEDTTLEGRKTAAFIDPSLGTNGQLISGPSTLKPGPFGWNCLTALDVDPSKIIGITIQWDDGMGFVENTTPKSVPVQHSGCDMDVRFYNSFAVLHNEVTGERRYWKIKGKAPPTVYIESGKDPVTLHILLVPTPPVDYASGRQVETDQFVTPIPVYGYKYKIDILDRVPSSETVSSSVDMEYGIMKFDRPATPQWWPLRCSCLDDPANAGEGGKLCLEPRFDILSPPPPFTSPTALSTSKPSLAPSLKPTLPPTPSPTGRTAAPTSSSGDGPMLCFSGHTIVEVRNKGFVKMKELSIGDEVRTVGNRFEPVYSFGHYSPGAKGRYLKILPFELEVTRDHMVFLEGGAAVPASMLQVGNRLKDGREITGVRSVESQGAFSPFTYSGTIVVNGVLASSFISLQGTQYLSIGGYAMPLSHQWLSYSFESAHRIWCRYLVNCCLVESYDENGLSSWVAVALNVFAWILKQHPVVLSFVLLPFLFVIATLRMFEMMMGWKFATGTLTILVAANRVIRGTQANACNE